MTTSLGPGGGRLGEHEPGAGLRLQRPALGLGPGHHEAGVGSPREGEAARHRADKPGADDRERLAGLVGASGQAVQRDQPQMPQRGVDEGDIRWDGMHLRERHDVDALVRDVPQGY